MNIFQYLTQLKVLENPKVIFPMLVWIIFWKGTALWKSAQRKEKIWFWLLMCLNTLGILEICYIFVFSNSNNVNTWKAKLMKKNNTEKTTIEPIEENITNQE